MKTELSNSTETAIELARMLESYGVDEEDYLIMPDVVELPGPLFDVSYEVAEIAFKNADDELVFVMRVKDQYRKALMGQGSMSGAAGRR